MVVARTLFRDAPEVHNDMEAKKGDVILDDVIDNDDFWFRLIGETKSGT